MTHSYGLTGVVAAAGASERAITIGDWIGAALTIILTVAVLLAARWVLRQRDPLATTTDPGVRTRVRLLQRMAATAVVIIGLAVAAGILGILSGIANAVLATSAITAVVVGFAARATLANSLAGVILTITQPVRVGDHVRVGEHEGVVQDVTLSATVLRTVLGTTIRVPNELLAQSVVYNDTIDGKGVIPEATAVVPIWASVGDAIDLASDLPGVQQARVLSVDDGGWSRIAVRGARCAPGDRAPAESRLRLALVEALRGAGMLTEGELEQEPPPST